MHPKTVDLEEEALLADSVGLGLLLVLQTLTPSVCRAGCR